MPRKATGTLIYTKEKGWCARVPVIVGYVDDKPVREKQWFELGHYEGSTYVRLESKAVAKRKMAKIVAENANGKVPGQADVTRAETVAEACERVHEQRIADGVKWARDEIARLRKYAIAEIGQLEVTVIEARHINETLDAAKADGKSAQTVQHLKQDLANVFAALKREGIVKRNPVDDAELPKFGKRVRKGRAVLTDEELVAYLAYEHPQEHRRGAVLERQTMACVARMFGGLRTGDLHALSWEAFDTEGDGRFAWGWAPRRKTAAPQLLEVPAMLRPILRDWWERHGRPTTGVLFPSRRGKRAGEEKKKVSHAKAFRRDLERAFGLYRWNAEKEAYETEKAREYTPRERELFMETTYTRPVDFHSWRRAFSQALADADVNVQQAAGLAGHASLTAHQRYLENASKMRKLPERALPKLDVRVTFGHDSCPNVPFDEAPENENSIKQAIGAGSSAVERWPYNQAGPLRLLANGGDCSPRGVTGESDQVRSGGSCPIVVSERATGEAAGGEALTLSACAADAAVTAYLRALAIGLAHALRAGGV